MNIIDSSKGLEQAVLVIPVFRHIDTSSKSRFLINYELSQEDLIKNDNDTKHFLNVLGDENLINSLLNDPLSNNSYQTPKIITYPTIAKDADALIIMDHHGYYERLVIDWYKILLNYYHNLMDDYINKKTKLTITDIQNINKDNIIDLEEFKLSEVVY